MNREDIEKFFFKKVSSPNECVKITFKQRETIYGLFLRDTDYAYLKAKNFWRIVPQSKLDAYRSSKNADLARIFNGAEFAKLTSYEESFD